MPVIETYSARQQYTGSHSMGRKATPEDFYAGEFGQVAAATDEIRKKLEAIQKQQEGLELAKSLSDLQVRWLEESTALEQKYGADPDFVEKSSARFNEMLAEIQPGRFVRDEFEIRATSLREAQMKDAMNTKVRVAAEKQKETFRETLLNLSNVVQRSPSYAEEAEETIKGLGDSLPPHIRSQVVGDGLRQIRYSRAQAIANQMPGAFLARVKNGEFDDVQNVDRLVTYAERKIEGAKAEANVATTIAMSNLQMKLALDQSPESVAEVQNQIDQWLASPRYETDAAFNRSVNSLVISVNKTQQAARERDHLREMGALHASGAAPVNQRVPEQKRAVDEYVNTLLTTIEDPAERIHHVGESIVNARYIPPVVSGWFNSTAAKNDVESVQQAAMLMHRVQRDAPYLVDALGDKHLRRRVELLERRREAGTLDALAARNVDESLKPVDPAIRSMREGHFSAIVREDSDHPNFELNVRRIFPRAEVPVIGTIGSISEEAKGFQQAQASYFTEFRNTFLATGDERISHDEAEAFVRGTFSETRINGEREIMPYAPDLLFSKEVLEQRFWGVKSGENPLPKIVQQTIRGKLSSMGLRETDSVRLETVPGVTDRTFKEGAPLYAVVGTERAGVPLFGYDVFIEIDPSNLSRFLTERDRRGRTQSQGELAVWQRESLREMFDFVRLERTPDGRLVRRPFP